MFEQALENEESMEQVAQEGDLFAGYEIKPWVFNKRIYQILAFSAVLCISSVALLASTNILTARGCDSPFVSRVCDVLDTVYVATTIFGTEREYADVAYEKTEMADADVTFIDVGGMDTPLTYPTGYFQIANPVQFAALQNADNSTTFSPPINQSFPANPTVTGGVLSKKAVLPKANPNALVGDVDNPFDTGDATKNPTVSRKGKTGKLPVASPSPTPALAMTDGSDTEIEKDKNGVFINKRPLRVLAVNALDKIDNKTVKLDQPFKVVVTGQLGVGKTADVIVLKNPKSVKAKGDPVNDPELEKLAKDAIIAVGDAGWFGYLDLFKAKNILVSVEQDGTNFIVSVKSDQPSENEAKAASSGLNTILGFARSNARADEQVFLQNTETSFDGKNLILKFEGSKQLVLDMIQRKLTEEKAKAGTMMENDGGPNGGKLAQSNSAANK